MEVRVRFAQFDRTVRAAAGTLVIDAVRGAGLPIASACRGDGLCGRCGVEIVAGAAELAPETPEEVRAKERNRIAPCLRLACRTRLVGDVSIAAPYW